MGSCNSSQSAARAAQGLGQNCGCRSRRRQLERQQQHQRQLKKQQQQESSSSTISSSSSSNPIDHTNLSGSPSGVNINATSEAPLGANNLKPTDLDNSDPTVSREIEERKVDLNIETVASRSNDETTLRDDIKKEEKTSSAGLSPDGSQKARQTEESSKLARLKGESIQPFCLRLYNLCAFMKDPDSINIFLGGTLSVWKFPFIGFSEEALIQFHFLPQFLAQRKFYLKSHIFHISSKLNSTQLDCLSATSSWRNIITLVVDFVDIQSKFGPSIPNKLINNSVRIWSSSSF